MCDINFEFQPTYLYIKQHRKTGLKYFGKTTGSEQYLLEEYSGSGDRWLNHLNKHGDDTETIWYCLYYDEKEIEKFALMCSKQWNIVESEEWANIIPENGLSGFPAGLSFSNLHKQHLGEAKQGRTWEEIYGEEGAALKRKQNSAPKGPMEESRKQNISKAKKGMDAPHDWSEESRNKVSKKLSGKEKPEGFSEKLRKAAKIIKTCPHCGVSGAGPSMQRWHFNHCKLKKKE